VINARPGDDSAAREQLGVTFRPAVETIGDTVRWLYAAGHISARQAGRAAGRWRRLSRRNVADRIASPYPSRA
jgi:hypothetical protein